ncbi:RNA methyltransferase [Bacteroidota bacterium]
MRKLQTYELNRVTTEEFKSIKKIPLVVVLDNVRSLHNVGSVFRSADAFKVEKIYLCGITGQPPHKEIQKTALGATESVDWEYYDSTKILVQKLKKQNRILIAIEQTTGAENVLDFRTHTNSLYAVIFGNEVKGIDQKVINLCDKCLEIPQFGTKHSLNISVCAGIVIWEFFKQLGN